MLSKQNVVSVLMEIKPSSTAKSARLSGARINLLQADGVKAERPVSLEIFSLLNYHAHLELIMPYQQKYRVLEQSGGYWV